MLVVIGTNCIGSNKSNYYTITTTIGPDYSVEETTTDGLPVISVTRLTNVIM